MGKFKLKSSNGQVVEVTPTDEQEAIIEAVAGADSVMIDALAGCSKSTTLEMAAPGVKGPALALAFNKKIATDLATRIPQNFKCATFNSVGFQAALRAIPNAPKAILEEKKLGKLITQIVKDRKVDLDSEQWDQIRQLVSGAMLAGITPGDRGRPMTPDTRDSWEEIADQKWIMPGQFEFIYEIAQEVLAADIEQFEKNGIFSFDDQVYYSACISGQFPKYPVIFTDETQDLNALNHSMLEQMMTDSTRLASVGDPRQSIYSFRGAVNDGMKKLRRIRPSWADRGLLTTFRCPKKIVARQQWHAPGYTAWHTNTEGSISALREGEPGFKIDEGWNWKTIRALLPRQDCGIMVLCRNNAPLLSLAFKLIRSQIGVVMLGRDIGKGLIQLSRKILPDDKTTRLECSAKVADWLETETSLARANNHEERVAGITDRGECLLAVIDSGCRDAGELRQMLEKLFARERGQVQLSTIHRAKGLETDCVVHLDSWRIPSKFAKEAEKAGDRTQIQQEYNLKYVCETRTKHTLIEADLQDFSG